MENIEKLKSITKKLDATFELQEFTSDSKVMQATI